MGVNDGEETSEFTVEDILMLDVFPGFKTTGHQKYWDCFKHPHISNPERPKLDCTVFQVHLVVYRIKVDLQQSVEQN